MTSNALKFPWVVDAIGTVVDSTEFTVEKGIAFAFWVKIAGRGGIISFKKKITTFIAKEKLIWVFIYKFLKFYFTIFICFT